MIRTTSAPSRRPPPTSPSPEEPGVAPETASSSRPRLHLVDEFEPTSPTASVPALHDLIFNQRIVGRVPYRVSSSVRETLEEAITTGRPLRVLGGGHGYLGSACVADGLVLDMRGHRRITFDDATRQMTVETGARFADIYRALDDNFGGLTYVLPTGDCPTVGAAGYTLGGGYGHLSRRYGMMCDNVVRMRTLVVDHEGEIHDKALGPESTGEDADLFFALRGSGGARFGVTTEITYQLRERPESIGIYDLRLRSDLDAPSIASALGRWIRFAERNLDDPTLSMKLALGSSWFHVAGVHTDPEKVAPLADALAPYLTDDHPDPLLPFDLANLTSVFKQCDTLDACELQPKQAFATRSAFVPASLIAEQTLAIAEAVVERRRESSDYGGIELMAWRMKGGLDTNNAFVHREDDFLCQFYTQGAGDERAPWMRSIFRAVTRADENGDALRGYQNYADATISDSETGFPLAHFGPLAARLENIKARYMDVFNPRPRPLALAPSEAAANDR